jgi:anti-sigma B factor antagonist
MAITRLSAQSRKSRAGRGPELPSKTRDVLIDAGDRTPARPGTSAGRNAFHVVSIEKRTPVGGHPVVALGGYLELADAAELAAAVAVTVPAGHRLIIDLAALEFIDCSGVRMLLSVQQLIRQAGGDLMLAAPRDPALRLFTLLRLADVLSAHASVAAAAVSAIAT